MHVLQLSMHATPTITPANQECTVLLSHLTVLLSTDVCSQIENSTDVK